MRFVSPTVPAWAWFADPKEEWDDGDEHHWLMSVYPVHAWSHDDDGFMGWILHPDLPSSALVPAYGWGGGVEPVDDGRGEYGVFIGYTDDPPDDAEREKWRRQATWKMERRRRLQDGRGVAE